MNEKLFDDDNIFEELFRQAVIDNFYECYNSLPPLEEISEMYTFSERHEKRMNELFAHGKDVQ